jgi:hypothetical protein
LFEYLYDSIRTTCVGKSMKQLHSKIDEVVTKVNGDYKMVQSTSELKDSSNQELLETRMETDIHQEEGGINNSGSSEEMANEEIVEDSSIERNSPESGIGEQTIDNQGDVSQTKEEENVIHPTGIAEVE